jgi:hypothetical protein
MSLTASFTMPFIGDSKYTIESIDGPIDRPPGAADLTGIIYAPDAAFSMNGGGKSSTTDFIGARVTSTVNMNGRFNFHYDESLGDLIQSGGCQITSWSEL